MNQQVELVIKSISGCLMYVLHLSCPVTQILMLGSMAQYADLNAFLLVAVNSHNVRFEDLSPRLREIIEKGKEGGDATVGLACGKSPLPARKQY